MNLIRRKTGTSLTEVCEDDYAIILLLLNEPSIPVTTHSPVTVSRNSTSIETVTKFMTEDVKQLMLLFWTHHAVAFQVYNFKDISSLRDFVYSDKPINYSSYKSNYLYYSPELPIEYPATLSARINSGIIAPIWKYGSQVELESSDEILKLESK